MKVTKEQVCNVLSVISNKGTTIRRFAKAYAEVLDTSGALVQEVGNNSDLSDVVSNKANLIIGEIEDVVDILKSKHGMSAMKVILAGKKYIDLMDELSEIKVSINKSKVA